jgi:hypothetical protein
MKRGDLVQVKTPLPEFGKIGIVVGPDVKWNLNPRVSVMFSDGVKELHFTNLRVIDETR